MSAAPQKRFFVDPYLDWTKSEGLPVAEDFCLDLNAIETQDWPRLGARGAFAHLKGRGDLVSVFVIELPPGAKSAAVRSNRRRTSSVLRKWLTTSHRMMSL